MKRENVSNVRSDRRPNRSSGTRAGPGDREGGARGRKTSRGPAERRFDWAATGCPVIVKPFLCGHVGVACLAVTVAQRCPRAFSDANRMDVGGQPIWPASPWATICRSSSICVRICCHRRPPDVPLYWRDTGGHNIIIIIFNFFFFVARRCFLSVSPRNTF